MNKQNINIKKNVRSILPLSLKFDDININSGYYKVLWGNSMWESGGIYKELKAFNNILPIQFQYKSLTWKELIDELRSSIRYLVYTVDGYDNVVGVFSINYNFIFYTPRIKKFLSRYTLSEYERGEVKKFHIMKPDNNWDDSIISKITCLECLIIKNFYVI